MPRLKGVQENGLQLFDTFDRNNAKDSRSTMSVCIVSQPDQSNGGRMGWWGVPTSCPKYQEVRILGPIACDTLHNKNKRGKTILSKVTKKRAHVFSARGLPTSTRECAEKWMTAAAINPCGLFLNLIEQTEDNRGGQAGKGDFVPGAVSVQRLRLRRHSNTAWGNAMDPKDVMVQAQQDGEEKFFNKFIAFDRLQIEKRTVCELPLGHCQIPNRKRDQCGVGGSTQWNCYCDLLQKARDVSQ
jgi:hypothetical protein